MKIGKRLPRATALAAMGLMLALGACAEESTVEVDVPEVDVPAVPDVDEGAVPDVAETATYTCKCGKTKEVAAAAPAPS